MATTFTHAIEINSASDAVNLGSHASIDDLTGFTVGMLMQFNAGTAGYGFTKQSASGVDGYAVTIQTSGRIDTFWDRATTNASAVFSSGVPTVNGSTWCWVFIQFDTANGFTSSNAFKVYSGNYGGALTNKTGASIVAGSGAYNTDAAQSLKLGNDGISVGCRTAKYAFIGVWNTILTTGTMDSYASDMSGNGGLAAAVDYIKWDASMSAAATSANALLTGTYVSTPALVSGPDASTARRRRVTIQQQYKKLANKKVPGYGSTSISMGRTIIAGIITAAARVPAVVMQLRRYAAKTPTQRDQKATTVFRRPRFMTGTPTPTSNTPRSKFRWFRRRHR